MHLVVSIIQDYTASTAGSKIATDAASKSPYMRRVLSPMQLKQFYGVQITHYFLAFQHDLEMKKLLRSRIGYLFIIT